MDESEVHYSRMLESFEDFRDKELVYSALKAAELLIKHLEPDNGILHLLDAAIGHRLRKLQDTYNAQKYRERPQNNR